MRCGSCWLTKVLKKSKTIHTNNMWFGVNSPSQYSSFCYFSLPTVKQSGIHKKQDGPSDDCVSIRVHVSHTYLLNTIDQFRPFIVPLSLKRVTFTVGSHPGLQKKYSDVLFSFSLTFFEFVFLLQFFLKLPTASIFRCLFGTWTDIALGVILAGCSSKCKHSSCSAIAVFSLAQFLNFCITVLTDAFSNHIFILFWSTPLEYYERTCCPLLSSYNFPSKPTINAGPWDKIITVRDHKVVWIFSDEGSVM